MQKAFVFLKWKLFFLAKLEKYEAGDSTGKNNTALQNQSPLLCSQELGVVGGRGCVETYLFFREKFMLHGKPSSLS